MASGILLQRREGTRTYFKADARSPIFKELQGLFEKTAGLIRTLQQALEPFVRQITCRGKVTPQIKQQGDRKLIEGFLPTHTPAGILLGSDTRLQFLDIVRIQQFPSLSIEAAIAEHSWTTTEEPDWNSMVDKFHLISALRSTKR
ncbi:MAG TPA: hypothetical protein VKK81_05960 [Candidatus Binatia bacterium]|nr:hypothetical protein [Candidatus Binatia bacterium]